MSRCHKCTCIMYYIFLIILIVAIISYCYYHIGHWLTPMHRPMSTVRRQLHGWTEHPGLNPTIWNVCTMHDDVIKWKHFPRYWPFVRGIHRSPMNSLYKGQWCGALVFSLICVWINGWVNNCGAGDLRRYRAHYDVNVMDRNTRSLWNTTFFFVKMNKEEKIFLSRCSTVNFHLNTKDRHTIACPLPNHTRFPIHTCHATFLLAWFNFTPSMDK